MPVHAERMASNTSIESSCIEDIDYVPNPNRTPRQDLSSGPGGPDDLSAIWFDIEEGH